MPVLQIYSPKQEPPALLLQTLCENIMAILNLPPDHAWAMWNAVPEGHFYRPNWQEAGSAGGPVVIMYCKESYTKQQVELVMRSLQTTLAESLSCTPESVYIAVQRVVPGEVLVRNNIWRGDN